MPVLDLDSSLLGASGCAYFIDAATGNYVPKSDPNNFLKLAGWASSYNPTVCYNNNTGTKIDACLVGQNNNGIIVAFRGTLFDGAGEFEDWFQDFLAEPVTNPALPGKVHYGFNTAVEAIIAQVIPAVQQLVAAAKPGTHVYVTGHSKGGGMAPIAALLMAQAKIPITKVVTFAAPKSGDGTFANAYNNTITNHFRYENYGDIAPFVCPNTTEIELIQAALPDCTSGSVACDLAGMIKGLIKDADTWNYQVVGTEWYITSASNGYALIKGTTDWEQAEIDVDQGAALTANIATNLLDLPTALLNAHTIDVGYGYMSGVIAAAQTTS